MTNLLKGHKSNHADMSVHVIPTCHAEWHWAAGTYPSVGDKNKHANGRKLNVQKKMIATKNRTMDLTVVIIRT
jgi:hypothetical protein